MNIIAPTFNFGSQSLYALLLKSDQFYIEKHENFQKRSERNKYNILNHLGKQTLSIPLKSGKNNQQLITDVLIAYDEDWRSYHLKCLQSAYQNAPYFDFYFDDISKMYTMHYGRLWDFNKAAIQLSLKLIKSDKIPHFTSSFEKEYHDQFLDLRKKDLKDGSHFEQYNQVFEDRLPFIPNLSILDLIFALGPQSQNYLVKI